MVSTGVEDSKVEVKVQVLIVLMADDDAVSEVVELSAMDEGDVKDASVEDRVSVPAVPIADDVSEV